MLPANVDYAFEIFRPIAVVHFGIGDFHRDLVNDSDVIKNEVLSMLRRRNFACVLLNQAALQGFAKLHTQKRNVDQLHIQLTVSFLQHPCRFIIGGKIHQIYIHDAPDYESI